MATEALVEKFKTSTKARRKGRKAVDKKVQVLERLKVEYVKVNELKPNSYNPNRQSDHDFELLLRSMEEDGFTQPVVVGNDNVIVDGEHRWRAAQTLELVEIPIVRVDMNEAQARVATIRHNRARGSHDIELEAEVLRDLQRLGALEWAQDSLMLDDEELNKLIEDIPAPEALMDEDYTQAWEPKEEAVSLEADTQATADRSVGMSIAAADALREREKKIASAKTAEDREAAKKDSNVFRTVLMFANDEAEVVKAVLGKQPAQKVLEMCRAEMAKAN